MDHMFADGVKDMQVANGTVRFTLVQRGAGDRDMIDVGRIILPVNRARDIIAALQRGLDDVASQNPQGARGDQVRRGRRRQPLSISRLSSLDARCRPVQPFAGEDWRCRLHDLNPPLRSGGGGPRSGGGGARRRDGSLNPIICSRTYPEDAAKV